MRLENLEACREVSVGSGEPGSMQESVCESVEPGSFREVSVKSGKPGSMQESVCESGESV